MLYKILKNIWQGATLARSLMNIHLGDQIINGLTLDIGGGNNPGYWNILKKNKEAKIISVDLKQTTQCNNGINLETDLLPYDDSQIDTILMFNILEHIYNYKHLIKEAARVLKKEGRVIGFVPFLVNYHPDPHDYFRYTKEALRRIFEEAGGREVAITEIGKGPFFVNYNNIMLSMPKLVRVIIFPFCYCLDSVYIWLRPNIIRRFPMGYMFTFKK